MNDQRSADGVQNIRHQDHVEHLLYENRPDHLNAFRVRPGMDRIEGAEIRWQRRVAESERALYVNAQVLERRDCDAFGFQL